jgi:hypothetical protein
LLHVCDYFDYDLALRPWTRLTGKGCETERKVQSRLMDHPVEKEGFPYFK